MAPQMGLPGKIAYCTYCHGSSGRGYYGFYVMPRLAGQSSEYIINQLHAFVSGRRDQSLAARLASVHSVDPSEQSAVAEHFASLRTASASDGPLGNIAAGSKLYNEGAPDSDVPACIACHGPDGKGTGPIPRLAGQLPAYTRNQLANWTKLRGEEANSTEETAVMSPIAGNMTRAQIDAVASYVSSLR
jgi:cytochrome c553